MTLNRRKFLTLTGTVVTTAPFPFSLPTKSYPAPRESLRCPVILVVDETIPHLQAHKQFDLLRAYNHSLGLLSDEHMCIGLHSAGDGSKAYAESCAQVCNGWIANMRIAGFEKVAVMVWTRRFGQMLTIPLLINADLRLARTSGHPRKFVSAFLRAANKKPTDRPPTWLECCEAQTGRSYHLLVDHGFKPLFPIELHGL